MNFNPDAKQKFIDEAALHAVRLPGQLTDGPNLTVPRMLEVMFKLTTEYWFQWMDCEDDQSMWEFYAVIPLRANAEDVLALIEALEILLPYREGWRFNADNIGG